MGYFSQVIWLKASWNSKDEWCNFLSGKDGGMCLNFLSGEMVASPQSYMTQAREKLWLCLSVLKKDWVNS